MKKNNKIVFILLFSCVINFSCFENTKIFANELVMNEGMVIEATNDNGTIIIEAGKGLERTYSWNNRKAMARMRLRNKRWYGSLGAYSPGGGSDVHLVVEEGQQHFCNEKEAVEWLSWQNKRMRYVYTPDGLVVGWYTDQDPKSSHVALGVDVWQFYIFGKKPHNLLGAKSNHLKIYFKGEISSKLPKVGNFLPSKPKVINGRLYSGKAIDYMADAAVNINPGDVEKVIGQGKVRKEGEYSIYHNPDDPFNFHDFFWVKLDSDNRVVLVGR